MVSDRSGFGREVRVDVAHLERECDGMLVHGGFEIGLSRVKDALRRVFLYIVRATRTQADQNVDEPVCWIAVCDGIVIDTCSADANARHRECLDPDCGFPDALTQATHVDPILKIAGIFDVEMWHGFPPIVNMFTKMQPACQELALLIFAIPGMVN